MVKKEVIKINKLPTPLVPLSRAIRVGDLLFVAGTTPSLNPNTLQEYPRHPVSGP